MEHHCHHSVPHSHCYCGCDPQLDRSEAVPSDHIPTGNVATPVYTHTIVIRNAGQRAANNVRLGHNYLPDFHINPSVQHRVDNLQSGGKEIVFPMLVPLEQVTVSYLYFTAMVPSQIHTHIKSDEGFAKVITVLPTPQLPRWVKAIIYTVLFIGATAIIYFLLVLGGTLFTFFSE